MAQVKYQGQITAWPLHDERGEQAPYTSWTCEHKHQSEDAAAQCAAVEARRNFLPSPDRGREVYRKWHTVSVAVKELVTSGAS